MRVHHLVIPALWILTGCASAPRSETEPRSPAAERAPAQGTESARTSMRDHFTDATAARDAVIAGRLEDVRAPLRRLAQSNEENMPADWLAWTDEMRGAAERGAQARTLAEAADAVAALGTVCGECHRTTRGGPHAVPDSGYKPHGERELAEKMARHDYAANALWVGLTGPEHVEWSHGAAALLNINVPSLVTHRGDPATKDRPPSGEGTLQGKVDPDLPDQDAETDAAKRADAIDLDAALRALRELGAQADRATIARDKQAVFAQIIARCGSCHARASARL
jgi:cytochrome c553